MDRNASNTIGNYTISKGFEIIDRICSASVT